mmetsp:Transcript_5413/g.11592  ORF Transcript_5413/g.11592 Transcript_5413/m.11592 type:complete len:427 (+) Transcript_5413:69-1349(+)
MKFHLLFLRFLLLATLSLPSGAFHFATIVGSSHWYSIASGAVHRTPSSPTNVPKSPSRTLPILTSITSSNPSADVVKTTVQQVQLASGTSAEIISCLPLRNKPSFSLNFLSSVLFGKGGNGKSKISDQNFDKPTLAFLHGSFHASWCWEENYMPYFASLGYPCVGLSLQGTGGTPAIPEGAKKVKIDSHVKDLDSFLRGLSDDDQNQEFGLGLGGNPEIVLIGHSFGGLTTMKWLETFYDKKDEKGHDHDDGINLLGVALLCSVPPSGNGPMTLRYLIRSFSDSWKITVGFAMKKAINDKELCRTLFFGGSDDSNGVTDEDIERYQGYFERDTVATIDLTDLVSKLPSLRVDKTSGKAQFVDFLPSEPLVLGASDDFIVDKEGLDETSSYMGLDAPVVVDSPHDVMLGGKWKNGADAVLSWLNKLP